MEDKKTRAKKAQRTADAVSEKIVSKDPYVGFLKNETVLVQYIPKPTKSDKLRIGWLGGSSHIKDLEILSGVAGRLYNDRKDKFQVVLCGYDLRGTMTVMDEKTGKQTQRPIQPHGSN